MKKSRIIIIVVVFIAVSHLHELLKLLPFISEYYRELRSALASPIVGEIRSALQILIILGAVSLLHKLKPLGSLADLGLSKSFIPAALFGILATLPMWIAFGLTANLSTNFALNSVFYLALLSPLAEEVIFRGFAFGQIRRHAKWRFWPSSIFTAVVFGLGHVAFNQSIDNLLGVFLITGVGGILFAWIYEKWDYNLWAPFWLHALMNLSWQVFEVGESAFAGWLPTILQVTVAVLAITLTKFRHKIPQLSK